MNARNFLNKTVALKINRPLGSKHPVGNFFYPINYGFLIIGSKKPFKMDWNFKIDKKKTLDDILEKNVDKKHYASPEIVAKRKSMHTATVTPSIWHENKSGNISSYPYSCALRAGASYNYLLVNGERRLTPREMLRLQGFPDDFKIVVSDCQTRKQAGNAIPVDMVAAVIERFLTMAF